MRIQPTDRHYASARADARAELLRDVDTFSDWIGAECMRRAPVKLRVHTDAHRLLGLIDDGLPTAELFAISMDAGQPRECRMLALDTIAERYLATRADDIERMANARAGEIAEQEAAELQELAA